MASGNWTFCTDIVFLPSNTEPSVTPLYAHWHAALIPSDAYLPPILFQIIIDFNSSLLATDWETLEFVHYTYMLGQVVLLAVQVSHALIWSAHSLCQQIIKNPRIKDIINRNRLMPSRLKLSTGLRFYRNVPLNSVNQPFHICIVVPFFCSLYYIDIPYLQQMINTSP